MSSTDTRDIFDVLDERGYVMSDRYDRPFGADAYDLVTDEQHVVRMLVGSDDNRLIVLTANGVSMFEVTFDFGTPNSVIAAALDAAEKFTEV